MSIIEGTSGYDTLTGTSGNDILYGYGSSDLLYGGAGNDTLNGGTGYDTLYGEAGNDLFMVSERIGGYYYYNQQVITIADFASGDRIDVSAWGISSFDQIQSILEVVDGTDAYFNAWYDAVNYSIQIRDFAASTLTASNFVFSTAGASEITGTTDNDRLFGTTGSDLITGGAGNDALRGGDGNDTLNGGTGENTLYGQAGVDLFVVSERLGGYYYSNQQIITIKDFSPGERIDVSAWGISSFDQIQNILQIADGTDAYFNARYDGVSYSIQLSGIAASTLTAADFIFSTAGASTIIGTSDSDRLFGSTGDDSIRGGSGDDRLLGGSGNDTLRGDSGNDLLYGQSGNDVFVVSARGTSYSSTQNVTIGDFTTGDRIDVSAWGISSFDQIQEILETVDSTDAYLRAYFSGYLYSIRINNVDAAALTANDFIFDTAGTPIDMVGNTSTDYLFGSLVGDTINGAGGDDTIFGGDGDDRLSGGTGTNVLYGQSGNDVFFVFARSSSTSDTTTIADFTAGDKIDISAWGISSFEMLQEILTTVDGTDAYFNAWYGSEYHALRISNVTASALSASDFIFGPSTALDMVGTSWRDRLFGSEVADTINGGNGDDQIFGGGGGDRLLGGSGNDTLIGGAGTNTLYGHDGYDVFCMSLLAGSSVSTDTVADFTAGYDRIDLSAWGITSVAQVAQILDTENGTDAVLATTWGGLQHKIFLTGVDADTLDASDFIFDTSGARTLAGTGSADRLFGSALGDSLAGGAGNDTVMGGGGEDTLDGGAGTDLAILEGNFNAALLSAPTSSSLLYNGTLLSGFEYVQFADVSYSWTTLAGLVVNSAPVSNLPATLSSYEGSVSLDLADYFSDPEGDTLSYSVSGLASGLSLSGHVISGTISAVAGGAPMQVTVTASDGAITITDSFSWTITNVNAAPTGSVTLSGAAQVGSVLGAISTVADADGINTATRSWQWLRDGVVISGATAATYTLTSADQGHVIAARLSYTDFFGTHESVTSAVSATVTPAALDVNGTTGADMIAGSDGNDTISGLGGNDTLSGGSGDDLLSGDSGNDLLYGGAGDDGLRGNDGNDTIHGDTGADNISGAEGNDSLDGGDDDDLMGGGLDNDSMDGGAGNDFMGGGMGDDTLLGSAGNDTVNGGAGDDSMSGGLGKDVMGASFGNDTLFGGDGNDAMGGGSGRDSLSGDAGNDTIGGGEGDDTIRGGTGNDFLAGGDRDDLIYGDAGDDMINGGAGNDTMSGGAGRDVFLFNEMISGDTDVILDFEGGLDLLRLSGIENAPGSGLNGYFDALDITNTVVGGTLGVSLNYEGQTIYLLGISAGELTKNDFLFM
ncbi:M10 family metallopeptidase C-terminal domain-containing protein [Rhodobacter maris]|uniref:Hemolysin type calcium-binding protein n=1 Tax=Rhodobacter maris TaxID=446682 RepID=A0A285SD86_9RHOB|nr:M10 family metallopeptidase C-terminal domain-containing protein [Rhodobacter maris]SOC05743.1 hemolysin type calcium-binding protein [Rhodobacter maris]